MATAGATTKFRITVGRLGGTTAGEPRIPGKAGDRKPTIYQETMVNGRLFKGMLLSLQVPTPTKIKDIHKDHRIEGIVSMVE